DELLAIQQCPFFEHRLQIAELPSGVDSVATQFGKTIPELAPAELRMVEPNNISPIRVLVLRCHLLRDEPIAAVHGFAKKRCGLNTPLHQSLYVFQLRQRNRCTELRHTVIPSEREMAGIIGVLNVLLRDLALVGTNACVAERLDPASLL